MISQADYVATLDLVSLKPLDDETPLMSDRRLVTEYRSGIGSLQWVAGVSRPDVAADTSLLQRPIP
eukprot:10279265-Alexandrium_andersonii.AAC.1